MKEYQAEFISYLKKIFFFSSFNILNNDKTKKKKRSNPKEKRNR